MYRITYYNIPKQCREIYMNNTEFEFLEAWREIGRLLHQENKHIEQGFSIRRKWFDVEKINKSKL